jgi:hypothetical protein
MRFASEQYANHLSYRSPEIAHTSVRRSVLLQFGDSVPEFDTLEASKPD